MPIDLLIVGPASRDTGGVARYVIDQQRVLPEGVRPRVFDVRTPPGSGWRRFLRAVLLALVDGLRFPFRSRPDVVHVHTSYGHAFYRAGYYVLVAKLLWRRPVVLHIHGSSFDAFLQSASSLGRRYQDLVLGRADRIVALSEYWKTVLSERVPPHRIVVIPNAVDPDAYDPRPRTEPPTITFVSNLIERKGVREFLTAIDRLARDGSPPFTVEIAGDGPLKDRVTETASEYEGVTYHGYVPEETKRELLETGSIFVLPTHAEGLPIALLEGMAAGNAVVSTRVGSIPEVIDEENGALVNPGDVDELTETLRELLTATDLAVIGERNHERIRQDYSWDAVSERLTATYRELTR